MIAILLCAGFGTRLRPLTNETPKGLLEVDKRPIIDYLVRQIADWPELEAIHLLANEQEAADYLHWWQDRWHRALKARGLTFHLHGNNVHEHEDQRGAVGDLAYFYQRIEQFESAIVASGDCIYRFPLQTARRQFRKHGNNLTLALRQPDAEILRHQSVLRLEDGTDRVKGIMHAPPGNPPSEWSCPALYFLKRAAFQHLDDYLAGDGDPDTLGRFIDYLARREVVRALRVPPDGKGALTEDRLRFHINTQEEYERANEVLDDEALMVRE